MDISINRNGDELGAYPALDCRAFLFEGVFQNNDWAWHEGMPEWKPLPEVLDEVEKNMDIYVFQEEQKGPFHPDAVVALVDAGNILLESMTWHAGLPEWQPLKTLFARSHHTMKIFVNHKGEQTGPFSMNLVRKNLDSQRLGMDALIWFEGLTGWMPIFALFPEAAQPAAETPATSTPKEAKKTSKDLKTTVALPRAFFKQTGSPIKLKKTANQVSATSATKS